MLICGKVINSVGYAQTGGGYKYKVKIRKANGRDTTFITGKEVFKKCEYYKDIVFDADIVYKKNGNIDGKNSNVNGVYVVGEDISEEDYQNQYINQKTFFDNLEKPLDAGTREKRENNLFTMAMTILVIVVVTLSVAKVAAQDKFMKDTKGFDLVEGEVTYISVTDGPSSSEDKRADIWVRYMVNGQNYKIRETTLGKTFSTNSVNGMSRGSIVDVMYDPNNPKIGYIAIEADFGGGYVPLYGGTYFSGYAMILISLVAIVLLLVHYIRRITKKKALYMQIVWPILWIITSIIYSIHYSLNYIFGIVLSVGMLILVLIAIRLIKKGGKNNN